jgi:diaminopropionate ammonia-lyase
MRTLGNPINGDTKVVSGESGAITLGVLVDIMTNPQRASLRKQLKLNAESVVLLFSTEGDTDPVKYRQIV